METFPEQVDRLEHEPRLPAPESHPALAEHASAERPAEQDPAKKLAEARTGIEASVGHEKQPDPLERLQEAEKAAAQASPGHVNRELKALTMQRELAAIRRKLPVPDRVLSKVIHHPTVRVVSEAAAQTVTRPSGLLGGGLVAFIGTTSYLYLAKHIGFTYQNSVFLLLFVAGFAFGLLLELAVHLATRGHRQAD
jgi:TPR repeat protein